MRRHGPGLLHDLHATMTQDVDVFGTNFQTIRHATSSSTTSRKVGSPFASPDIRRSRSASRRAGPPRLWVAVLPSDNGMPAREDRFELVLAPQGDDAAQFKHHSSGQVFGTVEALSEYLLTPVFTGRPR